MDIKLHQITSNSIPTNRPIQDVVGGFTTFLNESFYKIQNFDSLEPFFMSIVSSSDHWLFISSNGGLSAGRVNSEQALFPYYTEDKLTDNSDNTGSKSIFRVTKNNEYLLWEPFTSRQYGQYVLEKNIYKNVPGTALVFEEINRSLELRCCYAWRTSEKFGFVKTVWIQNLNSSGTPVQIEVLDGLQNILPANISSNTQNIFSCLLDAYKRSELDPETGLGIFALNSTLTDLAEPSESLLAATVFQVGLEGEHYLLSSLQLERFRKGESITQESEVRGHRGAYFVHSKLDLRSGEESCWHLVADTHQDSAAIVNLQHALKKDQVELFQQIEDDIKTNECQLSRIVARADGIQVSADKLRSSHHFANVMFNVMRGGIFADQYWIETSDFLDYVSTHLKQAHLTYRVFFSTLPKRINVSDLLSRIYEQGSDDLTRLGYTYLPLTFSRRHGDPSRPWNRFAINIKKKDDTLRLDYEGNWRDIFQNWEALAYSYPEFVEGMIFTFLCATTADGYNPYRIKRSGLDWESPEPGNPWANIGYWSDHQIIYLQKLMEISAKVHPGLLISFLERPIFSFANVPYRIKPYDDLISDPYKTIQFDLVLDAEILKRVDTIGMDGKLLYSTNGQVLHCSLTEKLLILLLAKLVNFVPEGGIWMNTQRPEWNDANNALVGKGLSVVTLSYLRRYVVFCRELFKQASNPDLQISHQVALLYSHIKTIFDRFHPVLTHSFDDELRRSMMDALGQAGSDYRWNIYTKGFSGEQVVLSRTDLLVFLEQAQLYIEHSLHANRRNDHLYHAYNILHLGKNTASIGHLQEMLEGQVAILSSKMLTGDESLTLLQSLRNSALYRFDQNSYVLYPDKSLPGFLSKNTLTEKQVKDLRLPSLLAAIGDKTLLVRDVEGKYHFSGQLHNAKDVNMALSVLLEKSQFVEVVGVEGENIVAIFEEVFHHTEFTGRSGTFFAYEGLGSIYWHMVSKLLLATQETALRCQDEPASKGLIERYFEISAGLGFNKSPAVFGAFPTDPYSHTPKGQGARQPGMTGSVKEEIIARQAEVGWTIEDGCLNFNSLLLDPKELLSSPVSVNFLDVIGNEQKFDLAIGSLAYTIYQVPVIMQLANVSGIEIHLTDGTTIVVNGNQLDAVNSRHIFLRDGYVHHLAVSITK
ncbi:MAG: hypothetical protein WBI14_03720 [Anaerolineaceae bacterium]